MIGFTYDTYGIPYFRPGGAIDEPYSSFIPDQFLRSLEAILPRLEAYEAAYQLALEQELIPQLRPDSYTPQTVGGRMKTLSWKPPFPRLDFVDSVRLAAETIARFDAEMGLRFQRAADNSWIEARKPGELIWDSYGLFNSRSQDEITDDTKPGTIHLACTGTLRDASVLVHEAGHYIAQDYAADHAHQMQKTHRLERVACEVQAYFLQEAFHDETLHLDRFPALVRGVTLYRHSRSVESAESIRAFSCRCESLGIPTWRVF